MNDDLDSSTKPPATVEYIVSLCKSLENVTSLEICGFLVHTFPQSYPLQMNFSQDKYITSLCLIPLFCDTLPIG